MSHKPRVPVYPEGYSGVFDTHAHLYDVLRDSDSPVLAEDVLRRALRCGVDTILIPADNIDTSRLAVDFVKQWNGFEGIDLYCSVGIHPHEASAYTEEAEAYIVDMVSNREKYKIKAIGEIGLDYYYDHSPRDVQRRVFKRQAELAFELDIPFILHERDASKDCLDIIRELKSEGKLLDTPGVCHCCSCSAQIAAELIKLGFYIGFDGPLTFKNNKKTPGVVEICPLDAMVVETDSPYLTPEPNRGMHNEPCFVPFVIDKIAAIKGISTKEAANITADNGKRLFRIK
ncbi:MAG: TatD family hydrolase [Saccharofermentans sp.]|nr:TatD family hydrolase [Saccharofermentans sp.]